MLQACGHDGSSLKHRKHPPSLNPCFLCTLWVLRSDAQARCYSVRTPHSRKIEFRAGTSCTSAANLYITNLQLHSLLRHSLLLVSWNAGACTALIACTPPSHLIQFVLPLTATPPGGRAVHSTLSHFDTHRTRSLHT